jgi:hypothetical protein
MWPKTWNGARIAAPRLVAPHAMPSSPSERPRPARNTGRIESAVTTTTAAIATTRARAWTSSMSVSPTRTSAMLKSWRKSSEPKMPTHPALHDCT